MKTIYKFILKSYFGPMILTFFIVMFVLMMNFMWRYIDELVGKGLDVDVILELMMYAAITLIPMGLPLATLLAAIMTMGNLGENYELLAMKSAGMSLPRIIKPLIIVILFIAIGSFFIANNLVPYSMKQMSALIYDIRQQKQAIEFKDGLFFNGIENMSIRVGKQHPDTKLLTDILIYDTRKANGNMTTTVADSGYIRLSDDKKYLLVTLYNGQTYEETRNYQWYEKSSLTHNIFDVQNGVIPLAGFDFERTNSDMFSGSQTQNIRQLDRGIDSLELLTQQSMTTSYAPLFKTVFENDLSIVIDSLKQKGLHEQPISVLDSITKLDIYDKRRLWSNALNDANNSRSTFTWDESLSKETLTQLYKYKAAWHEKMSLPVSIMIFFLIGAPLGAIIRKGGLGMPIVVSVIFFVIYYMISITGKKMAMEGSWSSFEGMWISTFILLPLSIFLTYKATNDSNLFNAEWYISHYKKLKQYLLSIRNKVKKHK